MPTCHKHGSGGIVNAKLGTIRYLAWIIIGCPQDTPVPYAKWAALAAALEMMFNNGLGTPEQKMRAAMWLIDVPDVSGKDAAKKHNGGYSMQSLVTAADDEPQSPDTAVEEASESP